MNKINLLQNVLSLQTRVNNLDTEQKKTSYARFKVKQRNIFGLALVDTGNLVHASIVSGERRTTSFRTRRTLADIPGRDGGVLYTRTISNPRIES